MEMPAWNLIDTQRSYIGKKSTETQLELIPMRAMIADKGAMLRVGGQSMS
jgi:hypothetical protein